MKLTCGIDWAEAHHDVALSDEQGRRGPGPDRHRRSTGSAVAGSCWPSTARNRQAVPIAIETDKNLLVVALRTPGSRSTRSTRERSPAIENATARRASKSDPGDAAVLADILRTDRHLHRPLPRITDQGLAVKALARQHQEAIWALHQTDQPVCGRCCWSSIRKPWTRSPISPTTRPLTVLAAAPTPHAGSA